jgi:hypothetical protein
MTEEIERDDDDSAAAVAVDEKKKRSASVATAITAIATCDTESFQIHQRLTRQKIKLG